VFLDIETPSLKVEAKIIGGSEKRKNSSCGAKSFTIFYKRWREGI
jgi:hypothetical protein